MVDRSLFLQIRKRVKELLANYLNSSIFSKKNTTKVMTTVKME